VSPSENFLSNVIYGQPVSVNNELTDVVLVYGETDANVVQAWKLCAERHTDRDIPNVYRMILT
jgi:hypothetical protein